MNSRKIRTDLSEWAGESKRQADETERTTPVFRDLNDNHADLAEL